MFRALRIALLLFILATLAVMVWTSWRVSLVLLLLAPALAWMMGKVGKRYRRLNHAIQESAADMLQTADQALHAQQDVKAYGAQPAEMARYGVQTLQNLRLALKIEVTRGTLSMLVQGLGAVGVAVVRRMESNRDDGRRGTNLRRARRVRADSQLRL